MNFLNRKKKRTTEQAVIELLTEQLGIPEELVSLDDDLEEQWGADSLDRVELVVLAEMELNVWLEDDEINGIKTVGDVVELVKQKLQENK